MADVVTIARSWIGTPYVHQASAKGAGCDCLGLIRGIWRNRFGREPEAVPPYSPDWGELQGTEVLLAAANRHLTPVTDVWEPGQVLLFRMRSDAVAKHRGVLANVGASPTFIHAYARHGVVESPLSAPWRRRVVARFAFQEG